MYQINGFLKYAERDSFEQGCLSEGAVSFHVTAHIEDETIAGLLKKARDFIGVEEDGMEVNACDEDGRVDFCRTENDEAFEPSAREKAEWRAGRLLLYYATYTGYVEKVERVKIPPQENSNA